MWFPSKLSPRNAGTRRDAAGDLGQIEQQIQPRAVGRVRERDRDLAADGRAAQGGLILGTDVRCDVQRFRRPGHLAVDLVLEEPQELGPSLPGPRFAAADLSDRRPRRVDRATYRADLCLVEIDGDLLRLEPAGVCSPGAAPRWTSDDARFVVLKRAPSMMIHFLD